MGASGKFLQLPLLLLEFFVDQSASSSELGLGNRVPHQVLPNERVH